MNHGSVGGDVDRELEKQGLIVLHSVKIPTQAEGVERSSTADLVRPVAQLIADVTEFMTLFAGDVLTVGVAANAPRARAGQTVTITIDNVGQLENTLVAGGVA